MEQDLNRHLDKLRARAAITLTTAVTALVFVILAVALFWIESAAAFVFLLLVVAAAITLAVLRRLSRREGHLHLPEPVAVQALRPLSFEELDVTLRQMTGQESVHNLHGNTLLYDLRGDFAARVILHKTPAFDKQAFDSLRHQIEQNAGEADPGVLHLHLICVTRANEALLRQVADNALHGLARAGGSLFAAVYHDRIELPPLYGNCDMRTVRRYRRLVHFIERQLA